MVAPCDVGRRVMAHASAPASSPASPPADNSCCKNSKSRNCGNCSDGDTSRSSSTAVVAICRSVPVIDLPSNSAPSRASASASDLWAQALQNLSASDRTILIDGLNAAPSTAAATHSQARAPPTTLPDLLEQLCRVAAHKKTECDAKRWRFEMRGRTYILRDVASKVIVWVNLFKQVGDVAIQYDPGHAALPWAGVRFLLEAITAESKVMGALLIAADMAAYLTGRCRIYEALYLCRGSSGSIPNNDSSNDAASQAQSGLEAALVPLYTAILRLLASAISLYGKSTASRALRAVIDPNKVTDLVADCQALEARVDIEAGNCERASNEQRHTELLELLDTYRAPIARMDVRVAELWERAGAASRRDVMCWASSIPYEKVHETARVGRTPHTAQWLLAHERFREWRDCSASMILWLHGIPGAGKTKLASMVIDHLLETRDNTQSDEALAYFYCDRNQKDRQDPANILRSFVLQLATSRSGDAVQPCLVEMYEQKMRKGPANPELSEAECVEILHKLADIYPQTTLVLDALDEADKDKRAGLIDVLDALVASAAKPVKVFISSRRDTDIKRQYEQGPNVSIEATDNADDISAFVAEQLDLYEKRRRRKLRSAIRKDIVRILQEKSNGMFQWAALQVAQLLRLERESDMRARLGKLPLGLQTAYDELYEQIQQQEGSGGIVAQRAIKWVMCSYWPLTTEELLGAVCQNPDDDDVASPVDIDDADFVLSATRNLLVIDPDRGTWKFAHLSVQEYFEDMHRVYGKREWSYYRVHAVAAKVCLLLLNDLSLDGRHDPAATDDDAATPNISLREMSDVSECGADKTGSSGASRGDNSRVKDDDAEAADDDADERASVESEAPNLVQMLTYAKWSWVYHVQQHGEDDIDPRVTTLLQQFLGSMDVSGLRYQDWNRSVVRFVYVDIGDRDVQRSQVWLSDLKPPTVASLAICRLGFYRVLGHWWQAGFRDANVRNNRGATLLMLAAKANNVDIATRLLRDGADVYARDDGGRDALAWASSVGSESVVRLLLDYGQDANQVGSYDSALCQAARFGTRSIVRLLLDRGADANAKDDGGNALQKAAYYGKTSIVELLLDRGANINAEGGSYGCALQSASVLGEVATVRLLLDRGADVNAGGGEYGSALQAASARGEVATARLLLDRGADVNAGGGRCGNALQAAAAYGDEATVQLLLDRGADVDAQGGPYGSALQAASVRGRESTVRLLLDRGANVNAQGGELGSALQAASVYHPETIVRLLLDRGADVNAQGGEYGSALQAAACNFWATDVVRLLLERGADVTLRGGKYGSALAAAIAKRNEEIETILRRHGATETED